jgi:hypothetical protein
MPNDISRKPPLNIMRRAAFFLGGRCEFQAMGIGMAIK